MVVRVGPGPTDYGNLCTECFSRRRPEDSFLRHKDWCSRAKDRCASENHEECRKEGCGCVCHPELTRTERLALRKLLDP